MVRTRLDIELEQRGHARSRARARDAILRGTVTVNGQLASKPNQQVSGDDLIEVSDPTAEYVSRAAVKLIAGLEAGAVEVSGKVCADIGASTGGFTQVLLERGAAKVYAIDVGHDQLAGEIEQDDRVVSLPDTDARTLTRQTVGEPIELLVSDVSFISIVKALPAALSLCATDARAVVLFKPQFEVGPDHVGKNGIVIGGQAAAEAKERAIRFVEGAGFSLLGEVPSPIAGGDGNKEIVLVFRRIR